MYLPFLLLRWVSASALPKNWGCSVLLYKLRQCSDRWYSKGEEQTIRPESEKKYRILSTLLNKQILTREIFCGTKLPAAVKKEKMAFLVFKFQRCCFNLMGLGFKLGLHLKCDNPIQSIEPCKTMSMKS